MIGSIILDELGATFDERGNVVARIRCEVNINDDPDSPDVICPNTAHSQICACGKKHSLGRVHYGNEIVPACIFHGTKSRRESALRDMKFNMLPRQLRVSWMY
jgi:hypothetical protein